MAKVSELMTPEPIFVDSNDYISKALGSMSEHNIHQLVVLEKNRYAGMLSIRKLLEANIDPSKTKCSSFTIPTTTLSSSDDADSALEKLFASNSRALPVLSGSNVIGVVSETDIASFVSNLKDWSKVKINEIANKQSTLLNETMKVSEARTIMRSGSGHDVLPVINQGSRISGVLTSYDLVQHILRPKEGKRLGDLREEYNKVLGMSISGLVSEPFSTKENLQLGQAFRMMRESSSPAIVVETSGNEFNGIIAPRTILRIYRGEVIKAPVRTEIIGLDKVDPFILDDIMREMGYTVTKLKGTLSGFDRLQLIGKEIYKGGRSRYELTLTLHSAGQKQNVHETTYDLLKTTGAMLDVIEKLSLKGKEKAKRTGKTSSAHIGAVKKFRDRRSY